MAMNLKSTWARGALALLAGLNLLACAGSEALTPVIRKITPTTAKPGDQITIEGLNFGNPAVAEGSDQIREGFGVSIGGIALRFSLNLDESDVISWDGDQGIIVAKVPADVQGPKADVVVSTDAGKSNVYPLMIGKEGGVVQPIIGWILHDNAPAATLFMATAAGLTTDPTSWSLTTDEFPALLSDNESAAQYDFNWGADWAVTLNDVSASLENAVAYLSISATDVSNGVTYNFLRPFEGYILEHPEGDLPTGLGPVRLGDWGPVVALGIGDQTVSHIDSAAGTVAAIDYVELVDANFIALGVYGGIDDATGLPYTMLVGNTKLEGTAKMLVLWQQPGETGSESSTQVVTIENSDWVLNGLVTSQSWNSWVVARHVSGCAEGNVYADCTGPDYVVKVRYRDRATEGTNFDASLVEFQGAVRFPDGIELRGIVITPDGFYLPYASRSSESADGDGVYMMRGINSLDDVFADKLTQTVSIADPNQIVDTDFTLTDSDSLTLTDISLNPLAAFEVTRPVAIPVNTYGTIQINFDDVAYPNWASSIYHFDISISGGGSLATYIPQSYWNFAPDYYGHPNTAFSLETTTLVSLEMNTAGVGHYNEIFFFPEPDSQQSGLITITAYSYDASASVTFTIDVVGATVPTTQVPAAVDIKTGEGGAPVSDPRDIYVIPETPLVLVTSHGDNSVAVINSRTATPTYLHNFPSYGAGPTRIACGVVKQEVAQ